MMWMFFDPKGAAELFAQQQRLLASATETIFYRTGAAARGELSQTEAMLMTTEKSEAFAEGMRRASASFARGNSPSEVATSFLKPMTEAAHANAERLRD